MVDNEDELIKDYTRFRTEADAHIIEAGVITWHGAHSPILSWVEAMRLPLASTDDAIAKARRKVLRNRKFFGICKECRERMARGHMTRSICHGCMGRNHGVVF